MRPVLLPTEVERAIKGLCDMDELFELADQAYQAGEYEKAFKLFSRASENGDSSAMSRLAIMYADGEGVAYDFDKSVYWDLQAIETGCISSMSNLAITYRNHGDARESRKWFEKACEAGDIDAALKLAKLLVVSDKELDQVRVLLEQVARSKEACSASVEEAQKMLDDLFE